VSITSIVVAFHQSDFFSLTVVPTDLSSQLDSSYEK